jgi:hypothetical protein
VLDEKRHVLPPLAQRRHPQREDRQPEIEILADPSRRDASAAVSALET